MLLVWSVALRWSISVKFVALVVAAFDNERQARVVEGAREGHPVAGKVWSCCLVVWRVPGTV